MPATTRRVAIAVALAAAGAAGLAWMLAPQPVPVETAAVIRGRFVATVDEDGRTRIRERFVVAAPLAGRLARIRFKAGDRVGAGDMVATILPSPAPLLDPRTRRDAEERLGAAEAARARAAALVDRARAQAEQAAADRARTRTLVERGASTAQALERAELAMRVAERDLRAADLQADAAEHELGQARALLARYRPEANGGQDAWTVTAPVPGLVLRVAEPSETIVQAGTPLLEIGDPGDLEIVVDVLSADAVAIRPGAEVAIERWGGAEALAGRVRRVEPSGFTKISTLGVEEQRVNVLVDILSPAERWRGLGDAFQLETRITVFTEEDATIIPAGALFRRGEAWHVFVMQDGRAEEREVALLRRSGQRAAVRAGLALGESVIVYPGDRVAPGVRVAAR
ncbi:MAG: HlyD family efflux transporter periplasmic adaptor subunit [Alphaproteobacteria bacterium]|nr:HlyD family efflux transporter periplasmic adaptor subunit [Alphaproteobacteria bacterium]